MFGARTFAVICVRVMCAVVVRGGGGGACVRVYNDDIELREEDKSATAFLCTRHERRRKAERHRCAWATVPN